jgi:hypothetical protein
MQSYYEINISKNGQFVFATAERSATDEHSAKKLFKLLKEKFPESEGYKVEVTYWDCTGYFVSHRLLEEEIK